MTFFPDHRRYFHDAVLLGIASLLLFGGFISWQPHSYGSSSNPPYKSQGFNVLSVIWGTNTGHIQSGPGDIDVPLTVTLQYIYPTSTAISTSGTLEMAGTEFSAASGGQNSTVYYDGTLTPGSIFTLTYYIDLNASLKVGTHYAIPLVIAWNAILSNSSLEPQTSFLQPTNITVSVKGDARLVFEMSQSYLASGQVNSLNFTIYNNGTGDASNIVTTLSSQVAGVLSAIPEIQTLKAGTSESFPLRIYVPENVAGSVAPIAITASYKDAYGNNASTSHTIDLQASALNEARLVFSVEKKTLISGEVNNITVTLSNIGSGTAYDIITTTSGSLQSVSTIADLPTISNVSAGASYSATVEVYVSDSGAGLPVTFTFSASYLDSYGTAGSIKQDQGFHIAGSSNFSGEASLSVVTLSNSVISGKISTVTFLVRNIGNSTIYSPTFTISVSQPLVVEENSTYSAVGTNIRPGESQIFRANLTASPSSTSGIYSGNLQVSFQDRYGSTHNPTYAIAVKLAGPIEIVIQNEQVSQNASAITVTGNLLNEGQASAYYSAVSGFLNGSKMVVSSPDYVGEIDPNSPVPFSVTIPYQAQGGNTANITIVAEYKNTLGEALNSSYSSASRLDPAPHNTPSSTSTNPSNSGNLGGLTLLELLVVLGAVIVAVGAGVLGAMRVRANRRARSESPGSPSELQQIT